MGWDDILCFGAETAGTVIGATGGRKKGTTRSTARRGSTARVKATRKKATTPNRTTKQSKTKRKGGRAGITVRPHLMLRQHRNGYLLTGTDEKGRKVSLFGTKAEMTTIKALVYGGTPIFTATKKILS